MERELLVGKLRRLDQVRKRPVRLAGLEPVVGDDPGQVPGPVARDVFDVAGDGSMALLAIRAWEGRVRDLADQDVLEGVLRLALDLTRRFPPDQVPRFEGDERIVHARQVAERVQHARPEVLAHDGSREERGARIGGKRIDARGDRSSHRRRQLVGGTSIEQRGGELLDEQGVPLGDLDETLDRREISSSREEVRRDRGRVNWGQRLERDRRRTEDTASPTWSHLEQFGPGEREEGRRSVPDVRREVLEEIELSGIRPMDVLEDEHRGLLERDLFDEPARREEQLDGLPGGLVARPQPDHRREESGHLGRPRPIRGDRGPALPASPWLLTTDRTRRSPSPDGPVP